MNNHSEEYQIKKLQEKQNNILAQFNKKQRALIIEAINIEYKLTMVEEGCQLKELD